jgi:hypothetical protein
VGFSKRRAALLCTTDPVRGGVGSQEINAGCTPGQGPAKGAQVLSAVGLSPRPELSRRRGWQGESQAASLRVATVRIAGAHAEATQKKVVTGTTLQPTA